jgi:3'(2'), 5'-bisphosphate nucleotidase
MNDFDIYLDDVRSIAVDAGREILKVYEREYTVTQKKDNSPLTEADRVAHDLIEARLAKLTPAIPVLSEESAAADYAARATWRRFWLVDPLDGTKEFISRSGEFTVNIALIDGDRPVMGVVHVPVRSETYSACRGRGAFRRAGSDGGERIQVRRFEGGTATVVASRSHGGSETARFLESLGKYDVANMGSSLKFCLVAAGAADVYPRLGPTMEWDTAAAQCVVEEAGGSVTDLDGRPLSYNKADLHNPWFIVSGAGGYDWARHLPPR